ncbi:MAG: serine/threonine protein phosphatase [Leptospiraceae bacterium]|nr:serine/threonine protein phosphatase [Leptospiraceae bacterium]
MIDVKYGKRKVVNYRGARMVVGGLTAKNKIDILLYISREFAQINSQSELFDRVLTLCEEIFEVDNIHLRLWSASNHKLMPVKFMAESEPPARPLDSGEGFSGTVFAHRKSMLEEDLTRHPEMIDQGERTRCVVCVPVMYRDQVLGTLSIEKHIPYFYRMDDLEILEAMASQLGLALNEVELVEGLMEARSRIESDLRMGRNVQSHIIPRRIDPWNGIHFYYHYEPMVEVSGDYFNVIRQGNTMTAIIADVSGHGVPAALVTMALHHHFQQLATINISLPELVEELNRQIQPNLPDGTYFTAQIVRIYQDHSFSFVNAGHHKLLHFDYNTETYEGLDSTGIPLGIAKVSREEYIEKKGQLRPGDFLVLLTDGFAEQRNEAGEPAGVPRVASWLQEEKSRLMERERVAMADMLGPSFLVRFEEFTGQRPAEDDFAMLILQSSPFFATSEAIHEKARKASDSEQSLKLALEAYNEEPSYLKNLLLLSKLTYVKKDLNESGRYLREYIHSSGEASAQIHCMLGNVMYQTGNFADAKTSYKRSLAVNPGFAEAAIMLSRVYVREERPARAQDVLRIAHQCSPGDEKIRTAMKKMDGVVLESAGKSG